MWIKNTSGKKDAMLTFATFSFLIVTLNVLLSSVETLTIGTTNVSFKALDSTIMAVYLGSTFTAYVSRRWTESKYGSKSSSNSIVDVATTMVEKLVNTQDNSSNLSSPSEVALSQIEQNPTEEVEVPSKKRKSKVED